MEFKEFIVGTRFVDDDGDKCTVIALGERNGELCFVSVDDGSRHVAVWMEKENAEHLNKCTLISQPYAEPIFVRPVQPRKVFVGDRESEEWETKTVYGYNTELDYPVICYSGPYKYMKELPPPPKKVKLKELMEKHGDVEVDEERFLKYLEGE